MVRSKFTDEQKIQIVMESINTRIGTAELCRKYNLHPQTFHSWRERFMESGKNGLRAGRNKARSVQKQLDDYKRIIGELTIANDALKKTLEVGRD